MVQKKWLVLWRPSDSQAVMCFLQAFHLQWALFYRALRYHSECTSGGGWAFGGSGEWLHSMLCHLHCAKECSELPSWGRAMPGPMGSGEPTPFLALFVKLKRIKKKLLSHDWLFVTPCEDCSLPVSAVHGILQPGLLERVAISFSKGSSRSRDRTCISYTVRWILFHWATWEPCLLN